MHRRAAPPPDLVRTATRQCGLVDLAQCRDAGLSDKEVRGLVARAGLRRVTRGVLELTAAAPDRADLPARRRRAAWLAMLAFGPDSVAVGPCALALHRVEGLPLTIRPEAALPRASNRRHRDGLLLRQFDDGMDVVEVDGRRTVSVEWALAQAVPELPREYGLAVLDSVLHRRLLDRAGLERAHEAARGRRGVATRHDLWELADHRAESPLESFARLECVEDGIGPHTLQLPLLGRDETVLGRGDLAWRRRDGRWLVAELDGADVHGTPRAVYADRRRQNLFTGTGAVHLLRFTGRDRGNIATTVRRALAA
jgi:hypothetical protein